MNFCLKGVFFTRHISDIHPAFGVSIYIPLKQNDPFKDEHIILSHDEFLLIADAYCFSFHTRKVEPSPTTDQLPEKTEDNTP